MRFLKNVHPPAGKRPGGHAEGRLPQAVLEGYDIEEKFYLCWVYGEVDSRLAGHVREAAKTDGVLRRDLESLDTPAAREDVRTALEAAGYLAIPEPRNADVEARYPPTIAADEEDLTSLAFDRGGREPVPGAPASLPRLRAALGELSLEELEGVRAFWRKHRNDREALADFLAAGGKKVALDAYTREVLRQTVAEFGGVILAHLWLVVDDLLA